MKQIIVTIILTFTSLLCFAAGDVNIGGLFEFKEPVQLVKCNLIGEQQTGSNEIIAAGIQFKIDGVSEDGYVIHILKGNNQAFNLKYFATTFKDSTTNGKSVSPDIYFLLPIKTFADKVKPRLKKHNLTVGLVTLPLKMHFGSKNKVDGQYTRNFLISSDVSLGLSFGYKFRGSENTAINILGGFSLSSVQVDSSTTKGFAKSATNASGITGHIGILAENNDFQLGVFTGIDWLTGNVGKEWIYRNRPWLGVAIGYSLFNVKSTKNTQQSPTQP